MQFVNTLSTILGIIFAIAYAYQIVFFLIGIGLEVKERLPSKNKRNSIEEDSSVNVFDTSNLLRYAFIISARDEENVISNLIQSIWSQTYSGDHIEIFVVADNCTDNTAAVARKAGAHVYERFDSKHIGKGYALTYLFEKIKEEYKRFDAFDGYIIFDADNILDRNFLKAMDREFRNGPRVIMGYRNTKNFDTNWITSGYSIAFMREAQFLNRPRRFLHTSTTVSGTGYLFGPEILEEHGGWPYHLLTEDVELSADYVTSGHKLGYCADAYFYDEQPQSFKQSFIQRTRWARGFYQVIFKYGKKMLSLMFKDKSMTLSCYDLFMFLAPSLIFNLVTAVVSMIAIIIALVDARHGAYMLPQVGLAFLSGFAGFYMLNFIQGLVTVISEWDHIIGDTGKKILSIFTYPFFMISYIPISFAALIVKAKWTPIRHTISYTIEDIEMAGKPDLQKTTE